MTRKEAIYWIKNLAVLSSGKDMASITEALDMAIKTLQHEQERREDIYGCPNCTGEVHKNYIYCPFCGVKMESDTE